MKSQSFIFRIFFLVVILLLVGVGYFSFYEYQQNRSLLARLSSVERQVAAVSEALQTSSIVSQENKQKIGELTKRGNIVDTSQETTLTSTVEKATPAVVSVVISKDVPLLQVQYVNPFGDDPNFRDFGIRVPTYKQVGTKKQQVGAGTGFIIRSNGYILTNKHVVDDTNADYTVLLSSGSQKTAKVVYRDPNYDLAILKIDGTGYHTLTLGNSSTIKLGQTVVAIGNALGEYNNSVSVGIVSGLNRTIEASDQQGNKETLANVIQTDAAINSGNSGGPLLDLTGKVIGINVATDRSGTNIAFAIPVDAVKTVINKTLN